MTVAELIREIQRHGGDVIVDGDDLHLSAPQPLSGDLLNQIRDHKAELLAYLNAVVANTVDPTGPCPDCGSGQWWQIPGQAWHCRACEPDMPLTVTTLTLPCHKERVAPVGSLAGLEQMLDVACEGLNITPEQLRQELEKGGDIPDLVSGPLTP
ncbi:MAG: hypothetical protein M3120_07505, partial [Pseudomonadota bacterium]|nr:hypothetical protein [Pseudomonadota bacterium]